MDTNGPFQVKGYFGEEYAHLCLEVSEHIVAVDCTVTKAEAPNGYPAFCAALGESPRAIWLHVNGVRIFRGDGGGEYSGQDFREFLLNALTMKQSSCANSPEQNPIANRELVVLVVVCNRDATP